MPKTKKNLAAAGIKEFCGLNDRDFDFGGVWVKDFKRKFWAKRGIDSTKFGDNSNNSLFVPN